MALKPQAERLAASAGPKDVSASHSPGSGMCGGVLKTTFRPWNRRTRPWLSTKWLLDGSAWIQPIGSDPPLAQAAPHRSSSAAADTLGLAESVAVAPAAAGGAGA